MKFSYAWLQELLPDLQQTPEQLAELLTLHSFETVAHKSQGADTILEADIASNRADCLSHVGLAFEIAALLNLKVHEPVVSDSSFAEYAQGEWKITIPNRRHMTRYMGAFLQNITLQPAPEWMRQRLETVGIRSINGLVDITNYVMVELGNPNHAFDAAKLPGTHMSVRGGKKGEKLFTLDGIERQLTAKTLVITSNDVPVDIAGVMGGQSSEVSENTKEIFLFVGCFNPYSIQKTAASLGMNTESSTRFSKGVDPNLAEKAMRRLLVLLHEILGAQLVQVIDTYPKPVMPRTITFHPKRVSKVAGIDIPMEKVQDIFQRLTFTVDTNRRHSWSVTVPTKRADLIGEHDLIEEALRVVGYNTIPPQVPHVPLRAQRVFDALQWQELLRDMLVDAGATEVYSYVYEDERFTKLLGLETIPHLELINPVAPELKQLRVSLLPGLLKSVEKNMSEWKQQMVFELGHVFYPRAETETSQFADKRVPGVTEELRLTAVMVGYKDQFRTIKGLVEQIAERLGLSDVEFQTQEGQGSSFYEHSAAITVGSHMLGTLGIVSSRVTQSLKTKEIAVFDLNADALSQLAQETYQFQPLPKFPPVYRDLAILVDPEKTVAQVQNVIERIGGDLVYDVDLFDIYEPAPSEATTTKQKSLAFHLKFQAPDRTLTSDEVDTLVQRIVQGLRDEVGAQVR